jgi:CDP-diacylglycerol--glycerol-3-phosphate 3-phosphatidyltransferase
MNAVVLNVPLILTLVRLILSPLLIPLLCVEIVPSQSVTAHLILGAFFVFLSLTDFFDGYLARRYGQTTSLGSLLDPLADKFLLYSTLISLVYIHKIHFYWAVLFIGREFFIMGLREIALTQGFSLCVSQSAKWKTMFQLSYLTYVITNPYPVQGFSLNSSVEHILLVSALFFTLYSAVEYYKSFVKRIKECS